MDLFYVFAIAIGILALAGVTVFAFIRAWQAYTSQKSVWSVVGGYIGVIFAIIAITTAFLTGYTFLIDQSGIGQTIAGGLGSIADALIQALISMISSPGITPPGG